MDKNKDESREARDMRYFELGIKSGQDELRAELRRLLSVPSRKDFELLDDDLG